MQSFAFLDQLMQAETIDSADALDPNATALPFSNINL
jgi:hypothetical protein